MYRRIPNACTKRNMARFGRHGPPSIAGRWGPGPPFSMADANIGYIIPEKIEDFLGTITRKENKND